MTALERIQDAIDANGGEEFHEEWCKCDPDVGMTCEYCDIRHGLRIAKESVTELLEALESLVDDVGFISDKDSCECGENGTGFDEDGKPCCHIIARRAIAKATGK